MRRRSARPSDDPDKRTRSACSAAPRAGLILAVGALRGAERHGAAVHAQAAAWQRHPHRGGSAAGRDTARLAAAAGRRLRRRRGRFRCRLAPPASRERGANGHAVADRRASRRRAGAAKAASTARGVPARRGPAAGQRPWRDQTTSASAATTAASAPARPAPDVDGDEASARSRR